MWCTPQSHPIKNRYIHDVVSLSHGHNCHGNIFSYLYFSVVISLYSTAPGLSLVKLWCEASSSVSPSSSTPMVHRPFKVNYVQLTKVHVHADAILKLSQTSHCLHILLCYSFNHLKAIILYWPPLLCTHTYNTKTDSLRTYFYSYTPPRLELWHL